MEFGRRQALGLIGAGAVVSAAPVVAKSKASGADKSGLNLDDPAQKFNACIKMRGALDDRLVISYVSGSYFGIVGSDVTPLWDVIGATFTRYRKRTDGAYDVASGEIAHFLDPKTGEAPGEFLIPYTGKTVTDPRTNLPPSRVILRPSMHLEAPGLPPGMVVDHVIRDPEIRGDDVWLTEVTRTSMALPGGKEPFRYSEMVTMHAQASDLAKPDLARVPCAASFTNVVAWRPWMQMGDHPGHLTAIGSGRYGVTMDLLPEKWTKATRAKWPHILDNPAGLLDPVWKQIIGA